MVALIQMIESVKLKDENHLDLLYAALRYFFFCKRMFPRLKPVTSRSYGDNLYCCAKPPDACINTV